MKPTLKEKLREESIWIALLIIFGITLIAGIFVFAREANYYFNGKSADAKLVDNDTKLEFTSGGIQYQIDCRSMFISKKDNMKVYFFEGEEKQAIVMSNLEWWALSVFIPGLVIILSILNLYRALRKEKMIKQKFSYDKKKLSSEELGEILMANFTSHQRNLYERHLENEEYETIKPRKNATEEEMEVLAEQEKIWKVGSVYFGVVRFYRSADDVHVMVFFTDAPRYIKDPDKFLADIDKTEIADIYRSYSVVDRGMVGRIIKDNRFFWIVGKPGLVKNCILLPEWYYLREELESM